MKNPEKHFGCVGENRTRRREERKDLAGFGVVGWRISQQGRTHTSDLLRTEFITHIFTCGDRKRAEPDREWVLIIETAL
jgi:hypothetical protein